MDARDGMGWDENKNLIAYRLQDLADRLNKMEVQLHQDHATIVEQLGSVKEDISALKVRAGFYGALCGFGASLSVFLLHFIGWR